MRGIRWKPADSGCDPILAAMAGFVGCSLAILLASEDLDPAGGADSGSLQVESRLGFGVDPNEEAAERCRYHAFR